MNFEDLGCVQSAKQIIEFKYAGTKLFCCKTFRDSDVQTKRRGKKYKIDETFKPLHEPSTYVHY